MKRFIQSETFETEKIKGSRFIVTTSPVESEEDVKGILLDLKKNHPNANHHCWAWRLGTDRERSSDDGEPSGSAGEPILQRMRRAELVDSLVIVTRYFGGAKLGVGGLVRAYGGSAGEAIMNCTLQCLVQRSIWRLSISYADQSVIKAIVRSSNGEIVGERYTDTVYLTVHTDPIVHDNFINQCTDRTSGRVVPQHEGIEWVVQSTV
jgi:uncharacterized YigZ family protein